MSESARETLETIAKVLLYCWILGFALQILTFGAVLSMGDLMHDLYGSMFGLSSHDSDMIVVAYLALIKLSVAVFFFIPWLAIRIVLRKQKV